VYSVYTGVSSTDLILGDVSAFVRPLQACGFSLVLILMCQATSRLFGSISALLWMPFCRNFGIRASYVVSICMGVAACCVILFPMSPILFWFVARVAMIILPPFHCVDFRFLSALVALSSTGTHICSRLLLSEHVIVKHASATFVIFLSSLNVFYSSFQVRIRYCK
jgi:hypothetical protein